MADKKSIIADLTKAAYWEENFIMKYDNPSTQALLKTLPKKKYAMIMKLFNQNLADTKRHRQLFNQMISDLEHGKYEL